VTDDRYGSDVLASDWRAPVRGRATATEAALGLVVEEVMTDFCGEIVTIDRDLGTLTLEDRRGTRRSFPLGPGFLLDGRPVVLTPPVTRPAPAAPRRTASGSVAVPGHRARVARVEGVVVEHLGGVDDLAAALRDFGPGEGRRVGVLVDHLVPGSKESRIADDVRRSPVGPHVLVVGHPYVDVWAAVRPERLGLVEWPDVPRNVEWKHGVCQALGWPHADQADIARAWRQILGRVTSYADLEPSLLGRVEELIDFVTAP
jgi:hypothetical protein